MEERTPMLTRGWPNGRPEALLARLCDAVDRDLARAECELNEGQRSLIRNALRRVLCASRHRSADDGRIDQRVSKATTEWAFISELFAWGLIRDVEDVPDSA